jgi:hypothetical protein
MNQRKMGVSRASFFTIPASLDVVIVETQSESTRRVASLQYNFIEIIKVMFYYY